MAEAPEAQGHKTTDTPHPEGSVRGHSGQYGVSDDRRAELSRLEQDAGTGHEAADETVVQRPPRETQLASQVVPTLDPERPGDRH